VDVRDIRPQALGYLAHLPSGERVPRRHREGRARRDDTGGIASRVKDDVVAGSSEQLAFCADHRVLATLLTVVSVDLQDLHVPPLRTLGLGGIGPAHWRHRIRRRGSSTEAIDRFVWSTTGWAFAQTLSR
jgi:hypothetical protein